MPRAPGRLHWRAWERLRRAALDRAGWRCERCGNGPPLEVHHRDGDRANNEPGNLEPLCPDCHLAEHDPLDGQPGAQRWRERVRERVRAVLG